jgi:hypothetical protein
MIGSWLRTEVYLGRGAARARSERTIGRSGPRSGPLPLDQLFELPGYRRGGRLQGLIDLRGSEVSHLVLPDHAHGEDDELPLFDRGAEHLVNDLRRPGATAVGKRHGGLGLALPLDRRPRHSHTTRHLDPHCSALELVDEPEGGPASQPFAQRGLDLGSAEVLPKDGLVDGDEIGSDRARRRAGRGQGRRHQHYSLDQHVGCGHARAVPGMAGSRPAFSIARARLSSGGRDRLSSSEDIPCTPLFANPPHEYAHVTDAPGARRGSSFRCRMTPRWKEPEPWN